MPITDKGRRAWAVVGSVAVVGVPLYTLSQYKGMGEAPAALRKAGLTNSLGTYLDSGEVQLPHLSKDTLEGRTKNMTHFRQATSKVYNATRFVDEERVIVTGGECSVTVGAMAGLVDSFGGKPGMLWLDAHGDFNTPDTSPSGYIGGMCLAMACGRGPDLEVPGWKGHPLTEERLVHVGSRALDQPEVAAFNSSPAKLFTSQQVKKVGAADVAEESARHLDNRSDWIACHLDVDVVDPEYIPSVNYPTPGGLSLDEASLIMRSLVRTGKLRAFEIAAYNAAYDRGGASAKTIVELVKSVFS